MLYYRSRKGGWNASRRVARVLTTGALGLYPAGAFLVKFAADRVVEAGGYVLIIASLACVTLIVSSSLQRIVGEQVWKLDEYEAKLRSRAVGAAYSCMAAIVLLVIIYCAVAADKGAWLPSTYDEFNGLFWGAFLYASILPSAFLAWQIDEGDAPGGEPVR